MLSFQFQQNKNTWQLIKLAKKNIILRTSIPLLHMLRRHWNWQKTAFFSLFLQYVKKQNKNPENKKKSCCGMRNQIDFYPSYYCHQNNSFPENILFSIHDGNRKKIRYDIFSLQLGVYVRTLSNPNVNWMPKIHLRSGSVKIVHTCLQAELYQNKHGSQSDTFKLKRSHENFHTLAYIFIIKCLPHIFIHVCILYINVSFEIRAHLNKKKTMSSILKATPQEFS